MYYCIGCNRMHEKSESGTIIFLSGFIKKEDKLVSVGHCKASVTSKTNSDGLEEKLAYLLRHAC
ncbi:DUF3973 domain-containing protein [Paenibacillus solisilvae]|uniref:DUF3973 domain-containing protein n=1 Tax=Paenibacillus solisilvae TaxID=2486751 RepID=A0ABW0W1Y4_9BACL